MRDFRWSSIILVLIVAIQTISCNESVEEAATASLSVLKAPSYFEFDKSAPALSESRLNDLFLSISGFPIDEKLNWKGITRKESVSYQSATLVFVSETPIQIESNVNFKLQDNEKLNLNELEKLASVKSFDHIPTGDEIKSQCSHSSLIYVIHTSKSTTADEINSTITKFNDECATTQNSLLAFLLVSPQQQTRAKRQAKANDDEKRIVNPAEFYRDQYPAIFNILFWLTLILAIVIYAIAYNMWYMDPGLDSVIYRMTSQRIKKDQ